MFNFLKRFSPYHLVKVYLQFERLDKLECEYLKEAAKIYAEWKNDKAPLERLVSSSNEFRARRLPTIERLTKEIESIVGPINIR